MSDAAADIQRILAPFRAQHGWEPGKTWDPYKGTYVWPSGTYKDSTEKE